MRYVITAESRYGKRIAVIGGQKILNAIGALKQFQVEIADLENYPVITIQAVTDYINTGDKP